MARTTYFGRIARGAKGAAADAVLSPRQIVISSARPVAVAAGDSGHDLSTMTPRTSARRPASIEAASRREEPRFAATAKFSRRRYRARRQSIGAGRERKPSRDLDAQFSAMQTRRPAQKPDTSSSAGVAMRERGQMPPRRSLESVARPDVAAPRCAWSGRERRNLPFHRPRRRRTRPKLWNRRDHLRPGGPPLTSAYRPDAASTRGRAGCRSVRWRSGSSVHRAAAGESCASRDGASRAAAAGERSDASYHADSARSV